MLRTPARPVNGLAVGREDDAGRAVQGAVLRTAAAVKAAAPLESPHHQLGRTADEQETGQRRMRGAPHGRHAEKRGVYAGGSRALVRAPVHLPFSWLSQAIEHIGLDRLERKTVNLSVQVGQLGVARSSSTKTRLWETVRGSSCTCSVKPTSMPSCNAARGATGLCRGLCATAQCKPLPHRPADQDFEKPYRPRVRPLHVVEHQ
ncbi:hypothetical protein ABZX95_44505 [Streptomyces sp. NPDC004232]|uniref:hypothetical protein n=1 Tax=Streptomyces sp. NPDC004232 TaxID=3154454 RepID=UPI0033ACB392